VELPKCKCQRCGNTWYLRSPQKPRVCPSCKSPYWEGYSEFVNELNIDSEKAQLVMDRLEKEIGANEKQNNWALIVREGWQRMFETSELPIARVDKVFAGGFSIHDWFMNTRKISLGLANNIAESFVSVGKSEVSAIDSVVQRAEEVLEWKSVVMLLDVDTVKVLAIVWFADKHAAQVLYPETELLIQEKIWQILEKSLGKKKTELVNHVEEVIEKIDSANKGVTSWAEIIRFA
jgi:hypothetical protein